MKLSPSFSSLLNNECEILFPGIPNWLALFLCALLINSIYSFVLLFFFKFNLTPDHYQDIARNLIQGNGYIIKPGGEQIFWRPPVYVLFLVGAYKLWGIGNVSAVLAQILVNSLASVLLYKVAKDIFSPSVGSLSALIYACYPGSAYFVVRTLPTVFFGCLLLLLLALMNNLFEKPSQVKAFFFGSMQGILTLTMLVFEGFPFFLVVYLFFRFTLAFLQSVKASYAERAGETREIRHFLKETFHSILEKRKEELQKYKRLLIVMFIGYFFVMFPWLIRNYKVSGHFVLGTGGGYTLWGGNLIMTDGLDVGLGVNPKGPYPPIYKAFMSEKRRVLGQPTGPISTISFAGDKKFLKEALRNFVRYPTETVRLMFKKMFRMWFSVFSPTMEKYQPFVTSMQLMIILPAFIGIALSLMHRKKVLPLLLILIYFQVLYTVFTATLRYSIPLMPILISFAVYGVLETYQYFFLNKLPK